MIENNGKQTQIGKIEAKKQTHLLDVSKQRPKMRLASMNVDNLRNKESIRKLTTTLKEQKIDIACIQETHNERDDTQEENDYVIIFGGNKEDIHLKNTPIEKT